jgi:hypothetical protein
MGALENKRPAILGPQPVLLVDDNHDDLFILKRLLTRSGLKNAFITFDHSRDCIAFF